MWAVLVRDTMTDDEIRVELWPTRAEAEKSRASWAKDSCYKRVRVQAVQED